MSLLNLDVVVGLVDNASAKVSGIAGKITGTLGKAAKTGAIAAAAAVGAATTAAIAFGKSAVDAGMKFDQSMSQVAATMGTTVDQIEELRDFAQEMGATTAFSASQAADALNYMALAGYTAQQSMEMLPTVLNLAAAGGLELATASDMITDTQSALGLSFQQTAEMVDQMAKASSITNTSVGQLGDAMLTVGGTARDLAGGTEELATVLGLLADNGVKGAEGGTALRNIILALSAPTNQAAQQLAALGVNAFDADGNLRPLEDTFADLNKALESMSAQERAEVLNTIFNKVDLKSVNALLNTDAQRWREVSAAIGDANGAAEAMAQTQLDNLAGDVTLFQSALEGLQIALSDQLTPTLREFVQFGSDGLSRLTVAMRALGEGGTIEDVVDVFTDIVGEGMQRLNEMLPSVIEAGAGILTALMNGFIESIPSFVEAAITVIPSLAQSLLSMLPRMVEAGFQLFLGLVTAIENAGPEVIAAMTNTLVRIIALTIQYLPQMLDAGRQLIIMIADAIGENLPTIMNALMGLLVALVQTVIQKAPEMMAGGTELLMGLAQGIVESIPTVLDGIRRLGQRIIDGVRDFVGDMVSAGANLVQGLIDGISRNIGGVIDALLGGLQNAIDGALSLLGIKSPSRLFRWVGDMTMEGMAEGIEGGVSKAVSAMEDAAGEVYGAFSGTASTAVDTMPVPAANMASNGGTELLAQILSAVKDVSGMGIYLDGRKLVGGIVDEMDSQLGRRAAWSETRLYSMA